MKVRDQNRPAAALLIAIAAAVGLAACGSSDASDVTDVPPVSAEATAPESTVAAATTVATIVPATTTTAVAATQVAPPATDAPTTTDNALIVSDAEVADLEKQLDEIDQLLAGVDADLSHD